MKIANHFLSFLTLTILLSLGCDREQMTPMSQAENLLPEAASHQYDPALANTTWENGRKDFPAIIEFHASINGVLHDVGHAPLPIFWHTDEGKLYIGITPHDMRKSNGLSYTFENNGNTLIFDRPLIAKEYGKTWNKRNRYWPVPTPTKMPPRRNRIY